MNQIPSPNFAYLGHHDARLVALATQAEEHFAPDPTVTLFKLRQFGEVLAQRAAAKVGLFVGAEDGQQQLIDRLWDRGVIGATQRSLFHDLRRVGNAAVHQGQGDHGEALHQLRMARELAVWFQRSFGNNRKFDPGPFVPSSEPKRAETALHEELQRLRDDVEARSKELEAAARAIAEARKAAEKEATERLTAQERAAKAKEDAAIWEALASEHVEAHREATEAAIQRSAALEEQNSRLLAELAALQAAAQAMPAKQLAVAIARASDASEAIELDEAATRRLVDRQLRDAGWEADSQRLTFEYGVRPTKGKNLAIAEWPTVADGKEGWADYRARRHPLPCARRGPCSRPRHADAEKGGARPTRFSSTSTPSTVASSPRTSTARCSASSRTTSTRNRTRRRSSSAPPTSTPTWSWSFSRRRSRRSTARWTTTPSPRSPARPISPLEAIRRYRNERSPNIAVTVDLLTTGIDVPRIANLVFLRRVRSRILYEQMIGRATRLCPEIGKERFRIFDAVDLYSALKDVTDMKPVVVNRSVTFEQLVKESRRGQGGGIPASIARRMVGQAPAKEADADG